MSNNTITHGWQDQPNNRGTFDIIKTCLGTIFLLCWSSVCPNVPAPRSTFWGRFKMRLNLFLLAILGPDFVFMTALGQANAVWRMRKVYRESGYMNWNFRHFFFINMGGLHIQFRDREMAGLPSFPVDCEQLLYLVRHGHIVFPDIDEEAINDRNKTDGLGRFIAMIQAFWFTIDALGRVSQGLFISTLELTTLGYVFLMTFCSLCWWRKPMDVSSPIIISVDVDLSTVLDAASAPSNAPGRTPLSFLNRHEWIMSQSWFSYTQILKRIAFPLKTSHQSADRFASVDFPETDFMWDVLFCWSIPVYSAVFMAAWNFHFPTDVERTLWRVSAVISVCYGSLGSILFFCWHNRAVLVRKIKAMSRMIRWQKLTKANDSNATKSKSVQETPKSGLLLYRVRGWFDWMRNLSPEKDPALTIPARMWILISLLCFIYCVSRAYVIAEDFACLRSLPASAFATVNWGQYSPIL